MYLRLLRQGIEDRMAGGRKRTLMRSGMVTGLLVGSLVLAALAAKYERGKGNFHKVTSRLSAPAPVESAPRPGGQEAIVLTRSPLPGGLVPEFLSATLLPGRGMEVLQITAYVPSKGEVNLLSGGGLAEAAQAMSGVNDDAGGVANLTRGGSFLSPWAGRLHGLVSADGKEIAVAMGGKLFNLPANTVETMDPVGFGGLLLKQAAGGVDVSPMPDGGSASAKFQSGDYDGRWPSEAETKVTVLLSSRSLELTVEVRNTGSQAMPVGIGWSPRFVLPSGDRGAATLHVPADVRSEVRDAKTGMPSGKLVAVAGTAYDFNARNGVALGELGLNDTFAHLKSVLGERPVVELRDPAAKFGLRITALSLGIKAIQVFSPAKEEFVSISPQMNFDDPFGKEWPAGEDTGMAQLQPGQSVQWKVRLELFRLMNPPEKPF